MEVFFVVVADQEDTHLFQERITLSTTQEAFAILINKTLQTMVDRMHYRMNKALSTMTKLPWSTWEAVGDTSPYVSAISAALKEEVPTVALLISGAYHNFFCTTMVSTLIPKYIDTIFKCRRVGEMGAQQMAMDAQVCLCPLHRILACLNGELLCRNVAYFCSVEKILPGAQDRHALHPEHRL